MINGPYDRRRVNTMTIQAAWTTTRVRETMCPVGAVLGLLMAVIGCETSNRPTAAADPATLAAQSAERLLAEEPSHPLGVEEFRDQLLGPADSESPGETAATTGQSTPPQTVVLLGRLGGKPLAGNHLAADTFPFEPGKASFVICDASFDPDASTDDHHHDDPDHDCPFCAASKDAAGRAHAVVRFLDDQGRTLPFDTRDLFDLKGGEIVILEGTGKLTVGTLMIDADKIFIRR